MAYSKDGKRLARGEGNHVVVCCAESGLEQCQLKAHSDWVRAVAWSPCGQWLTSGGDDKMIYVYDAKTFEVKWPLNGHDHAVVSVSWSPDGTRLASGSLDKTVRLWDASTGAPIGSPLKVDGEVKSVVWSPCGKKLAATCNVLKGLFDWDGSVKIFT